MDRQKIEKAGTFILGGLAGAAAGILMAPRSGRELRGAMSSRAGEARERGREGYFEARERARERAAGMREPRPDVREEAPLGASGGSAPGEGRAEPPPAFGPPSLRAVSSEDESAEERVEEDAEAEALRRRVRQARERLGRRGRGGGSDG